MIDFKEKESTDLDDWSFLGFVSFSQHSRRRLNTKFFFSFETNVRASVNTAQQHLGLQRSKRLNTWFGSSNGKSKIFHSLASESFE
jgi:hypothetical protein